MANSYALLRLGLFIAAIAIAVALVAAHGIRGLAFLVVLLALISVPKTRGFHWIDRGLIRLAGSRQRGWAAVMVVGIVIVLAVNIYPLIHG